MEKVVEQIGEQERNVDETHHTHQTEEDTSRNVSKTPDKRLCIFFLILLHAGVHNMGFLNICESFPIF